MEKITIENIRDDWGACYWEDDNFNKEAKWVEDHLPATPLEILSWDNIPAQDRLWAVLREDIVPERYIHLLACDFADKALSLVDNPHKDSLEAIRIKRLWVDGKATDKELAAASDAVWASAWDAAWAEQIEMTKSVLCKIAEKETK